MNTSLNSAKTKKNDEFFTLYKDIEKEVSNYTDYFTGKVVYCNCDDPKYSNFWKYFKDNFEQLKIKKLVATYYEKDGIVFKHELNRGGRLDKTILKQHGDFASQECVEILKESDIVVTNPPFPLFREYVILLMEYEKKFLIIGNMNAILYNEIFPLIKDNQLWLGCRGLNKDMYFDVPNERKKWLVENKKEGSAYKIIDGVVMGRLASACWFTNLVHKKCREELILHRKYTPSDYPRYDNYDAINVNKIKNIPCDYYGAMGVPITFLDKYNPSEREFAILDKLNNPVIDGKNIYKRIIIKRIKN